MWGLGVRPTHGSPRAYWSDRRLCSSGEKSTLELRIDVLKSDLDISSVVDVTVRVARIVLSDLRIHVGVSLLGSSMNPINRSALS